MKNDTIKFKNTQKNFKVHLDLDAKVQCRLTITMLKVKEMVTNLSSVLITRSSVLSI